MTPQQINNLTESEFKEYFDKVCSFSKLFRVPDENGVLKPLNITEGQKQIFFSLVTCWQDRVIAITPSRYGKCIQKDQRVIMADGTYKAIKDISKGDIVLNMDDNYKIVKDVVKGRIYNGKKDIFKTITSTGKEILTTDNHPFYTKDGWKQLKDLKIGDRIATPRKSTFGDNEYDLEKIKMLGYLLGDGSISTNTVSVSGGNNEQSYTILKELKTFKGVGHEYQKKDGSGWSICFSDYLPFLRDIGLYKTNSHTKFIPSFIYTLKKEYIAIFLSRLFACDGWASIVNNHAEIGYCSVSKELIYGVSNLLLKFGILSRIDLKRIKYKNDIRFAYQLTIITNESKKRFIEEINIFSKEKKCKLILDLINTYIDKPLCDDIIPLEYVDKSDLWKEDYRGNINFNTKENISRKILQKILNNYIKYDKIANSDIYWDKVKSIEYIGEDDVYDIEIENNHNFICENIFVHNSYIIAAGIITRISLYPNEKWVIVAPSEPKAGIIMKYIQQMLFRIPDEDDKTDMNPFRDMIPKSFIDTTDKALHEKSRKRITLTNGSSISILSADSDSKSESGMKLMGHGVGKGLIIDESCELDDITYTKAFRMLGDNPNTVLFELGNPWRRNHFYKSFNNPDYYAIKIDWRQALKEGRFTEKYINEMRGQADFDVLMEANFPEADKIDKDGYITLFAEDFIKDRVIIEEPPLFGRLRLGLDVSYKGKDSNVWVLRNDNFAQVIYKTHDENPLNVINDTLTIMNEYGIDEKDVYMDATAGGNIIYQRFVELGYHINAISFGEKPFDRKFRDVKAEGFFMLYEWLNKGGQLLEHKDWIQLKDIKYKSDVRGLSIISKDELRKSGIHSPDVADALMLTCIGGIDNKTDIQNKQILIKKTISQPKYI